MNTISSILSYRNHSISSIAAQRALLFGFFVIVTSIGAYIRIPLPFTPVPITLQTFFVLLCGALLKRKLGSLAQLTYLLLGLIGVPVFQGYLGFH